ncbi:probable glycosyltransferase [Tanacetum coccineum]
MEHYIKALCSPDVNMRFKIGRDVSLPECYVRSARNPLRDLGGKLSSHRHNFAFYAGNMHKYLRKILLEYWDNKDADMKIMGPMPPGVANKMNYIQHMKSSKYCIWPKGYEVLKWDAFSVIVAEKDIPNLKSILTAITDEKYKELRVKRIRTRQPQASKGGATSASRGTSKANGMLFTNKAVKSRTIYRRHAKYFEYRLQLKIPLATWQVSHRRGTRTTLIEVWFKRMHAMCASGCTAEAFPWFHPYG